MFIVTKSLPHVTSGLCIFGTRKVEVLNIILLVFLFYAQNRHALKCW